MQPNIVNLATSIKRKMEKFPNFSQWIRWKGSLPPGVDTQIQELETLVDLLITNLNIVKPDDKILYSIVCDLSVLQCEWPIQ